MTSPKPSAKRARVMWADYDPEYEAAVAFQVYPKAADSCRTHDLKQFPVLVLPMPSLKAAQKRRRFEMLSEDQQVEAISRMIFVPVGSPKGSTDRIARMALNVIKGEAL